MTTMLRCLAIALCAALCLATPASATKRPGPIRHVFVVLLENENADVTFGPGSPAPYLSQTLPAQGKLLPNYYAVTHLSLGNYVALVSGQGSNPQTQSDCQTYSEFAGTGPVGPDGQALGDGCVYPASVKTVADQLAAAGLSWKGYMEDMGNDPARESATCGHPAPNSPDGTQNATPTDQYAARHNPFVYFHSLLDTGACAANDVPLSRLESDLASARTTANYSFITPNLCDDGHDSPCADGRPGGLATADEWLRTWIPKILASPAYQRDGLLLVTFDEAESSGQSADASACCNEAQFPNTPNNGGPVPGRGGGRVGAVALSPSITPGTVSTTPYNHFSFLRTVEDLFRLGHLGYAGSPDPGAFGPDVFGSPASTSTSTSASASAPTPAPAPRAKAAKGVLACRAGHCAITFPSRLLAPRRAFRGATFTLSCDGYVRGRGTVTIRHGRVRLELAHRVARGPYRLVVHGRHRALLHRTIRVN